MIFEGSSEIMRLFIAREALDPHLKVGGAIFNTQLPMSQRAKAVFTSGKFYAGWYPKQWLPGERRRHRQTAPRSAAARPTTPRARARRLARGLFHAMARFGPKLDREQLLLSRFVGIATELFAISATCSFAQYKIDCWRAGRRNPFGGELFLSLRQNANRPSFCRHLAQCGQARVRSDAGVDGGKTRKFARRESCKSGTIVSGTGTALLESGALLALPCSFLRPRHRLRADFAHSAPDRGDRY